MNKVKEIERINEKELELGVAGTKASWHGTYDRSAWVFVGGLAFNLSEGDILCVFSQWGEIDDIHLVRDEETGKSKGFCFIKYMDQRSTTLAVDNFNGIEILGRIICVDHKLDYQPPRKKKEERPADDDLNMKEHQAGHAYEGKQLANEYSIHKGVDLFAAPPSDSSDSESTSSRKHQEATGADKPREKKHKKKHHKKDKKSHKKHRSESYKAPAEEDPEAGLLPMDAVPALLGPAQPQLVGPETQALGEGPIMSWRGRLDPTRAATIAAAAAPKPAPLPKHDEPELTGLHRRR